MTIHKTKLFSVLLMKVTIWHSAFSIVSWQVSWYLLEAPKK
jgi:hypothetical protein